MNQGFNELHFLRRFRSGDQKALEQLFKSFYPSICNQIHLIIKDEAQTEDVAQELFMDLWKKRAQLPEINSWAAYLRRAARNRALNVIRSRKVRWEQLEDQSDLSVQTPNAQDTMEHDDLKVIIQQTIQALPERCRLIFTLSRYEDMSYKQIAEHLNISVKTVENQMSKALRLLREAVKLPRND